MIVGHLWSFIPFSAGWLRAFAYVMVGFDRTIVLGEGNVGCPLVILERGFFSLFDGGGYVFW